MMNLRLGTRVLRRVTASMLTASLVGTSALVSPLAALAQENADPLATSIRSAQGVVDLLQRLVGTEQNPGPLAQQAALACQRRTRSLEAVAAIDRAMRAYDLEVVTALANNQAAPMVRIPNGKNGEALEVSFERAQEMLVAEQDQANRARLQCQSLSQYVSWIRQHLPAEQQRITAARQITERLAAARTRLETLGRAVQDVQQLQQEIQVAQQEIRGLQGQGQEVALAGVGGFARRWAVPVFLGAAAGWWLRDRIGGGNLQQQAQQLQQLQQQLLERERQLQVTRDQGRCNAAWTRAYVSLVLGGGVSDRNARAFLAAVLQAARTGAQAPAEPEIQPGVRGFPKHNFLRDQIRPELAGPIGQDLRANVDALIQQELQAIQAGVQNFVDQCRNVQGNPPF